MMMKKSLGQGGPGPQGPLDPLLVFPKIVSQFLAVIPAVSSGIRPAILTPMTFHCGQSVQNKFLLFS